MIIVLSSIIQLPLWNKTKNQKMHWCILILLHTFRVMPILIYSTWLCKTNHRIKNYILNWAQIEIIWFRNILEKVIQIALLGAVGGVPLTPNRKLLVHLFPYYWLVDYYLKHSFLLLYKDFKIDREEYEGISNLQCKLQRQLLTTRKVYTFIQFLSGWWRLFKVLFRV